MEIQALTKMALVLAPSTVTTTAVHHASSMTSLKNIVLPQRGEAGGTVAAALLHSMGTGTLLVTIWTGFQPSLVHLETTFLFRQGHQNDDKISDYILHNFLILILKAFFKELFFSRVQFVKKQK